mmetsp:Transcript_21686/g.36123  ORF Transcript_21686/g.36123 Transcript_21686/m.36123 type:complete len:293 (-) Transcript_21686:252-1130(-)
MVANKSQRLLGSFFFFRGGLLMITGRVPKFAPRADRGKSALLWPPAVDTKLTAVQAEATAVGGDPTAAGGYSQRLHGTDGVAGPPPCPGRVATARQPGPVPAYHAPSALRAAQLSTSESYSSSSGRKPGAVYARGGWSRACIRFNAGDGVERPTAYLEALSFGMRRLRSAPLSSVSDVSGEAFGPRVSRCSRRFCTATDFSSFVIWALTHSCSYLWCSSADMDACCPLVGAPKVALRSRSTGTWFLSLSSCPGFVMMRQSWELRKSDTSFDLALPSWMASLLSFMKLRPWST